MFGEERTRTLLGPADPARNTAVAPPRISARDLIERAGATEPGVRHRASPQDPPAGPDGRDTGGRGRRGGGPPAVRRGGTPNVDDAPGLVLVPVAYQFNADASAAGPHAARPGRQAGRRRVRQPHRALHVPPHEGVGRPGDDVRRWSPSRSPSPTRRRSGRPPTGPVRQVSTQLEPEYPDQESREYWQRHLDGAGPGAKGTPGPDTVPLPPEALATLPSDRSRLRELLKVEYGAGAASKEVSTVYGRYVVPRQTRAEILRVLADVPGFLWRGQVTDRAGRSGLAVTFDDRAHDAQSLLIFDQETGELLAHERLTLSAVRISAYKVFLETAWTERLG